MKYYTGKNIRAKHAIYNVIFGERSNGKTFDVLLEGYRKYIDSGDKVSKNDMEELLNAFNRGGFSEAYFSGKTGEAMMSIEKPGNDSSNTFTSEVKQRARLDANVRRVPVHMYCELRDGEAVNLTVWDDDGNSVAKTGTQKAEAAQNKPLTKERLQSQL